MKRLSREMKQHKNFFFRRFGKFKRRKKILKHRKRRTLLRCVFWDTSFLQSEVMRVFVSLYLDRMKEGCNKFFER